LASFILNLIMIISSFKFNIFSLTQVGNSDCIYDLSYMTFITVCTTGNQKIMKTVYESIMKIDNVRLLKMVLSF